MRILSLYSMRIQFYKRTPVQTTIMDDYDYGTYAGNCRFAMDQVPGNVEVANQTLNDIGQGECFLINAKRDMRGRQCTIQVCVRAVGDQIIPLVLIFKNKKPRGDRWGTKSGLENRKHMFRGQLKAEKDFYDPRARVMWDPKAWFSEPCAISWYEMFLEIIEENLEDQKVVIQQDNLNTQNTYAIKEMTHKSNVFQCNVTNVRMCVL